jgi:hypothetical protein
MRFLLILANDAIRKKAKEWIDKAPDRMRVEFREAKRSNEQNSKMWAMLTDISEQVTHAEQKYDTDRWKVIMLYGLGREVEFLPSHDNVTFVPYGPRSSELSVAEMSEMIEFMLAFGAEHDVIFHDPETERGAASADADDPEKEARINAPALHSTQHTKETIT